MGRKSRAKAAHREARSRAAETAPGSRAPVTPRSDEPHGLTSRECGSRRSSRRRRRHRGTSRESSPCQGQGAIDLRVKAATTYACWLSSNSLPSRRSRMRSAPWSTVDTAGPTSAMLWASPGKARDSVTGGSTAMKIPRDAAPSSHELRTRGRLGGSTADAGGKRSRPDRDPVASVGRCLETIHRVVRVCSRTTALLELRRHPSAQLVSRHIGTGTALPRSAV